MSISIKNGVCVAEVYDRRWSSKGELGEITSQRIPRALDYKTLLPWLKLAASSGGLFLDQLIRRTKLGASSQLIELM